MRSPARVTTTSLLTLLLLVSITLVALPVRALAAYTWADLGTAPSSILDMKYTPQVNSLYAACVDGNVYSRSLPVGSWTTGGPGMGVQANCLAYDHTGARIFTGLGNGQVWEQDLLDSGAWGSIGNPGGGIVYSMVYDPVGDILYVGCANQHVYRWSPPFAWLDVGSPGPGIPLALEVDAQRRVLYAGCNDGMVYSKALPADPWTPTGGPGSAGEQVYSMALDGTRNVLYVGLSVIDVGDPNVFRLDVGQGGDWTAIGTLCGGPFIISMVVDEEHDYLFAGADNSHVYKNCGASTGNKWADMGNLASRAGGLDFDPEAGAVFAGLQTGTVRSTLLPETASISPASGKQGETLNVVINGTHTDFDTTSAARFSGSGITVNSCTRNSDTRVTANITISETAAVGARDVWVETDTPMDPDATTRLTGGFTVNSDLSTWYLAEGTCAWGFSTYISIQNPNGTAVDADVTYMPKGAANASETVTLPANSQTTLTNDHLVEKMGGTYDFSTKVESDDRTKPIAVDRTMGWSGGAGASGAGSYPEAHCSVGVTSPAITWYLPEGSTNWGFETWLLIQNPNGGEASCDVTYMVEGKPFQTVNHKVPANSRESFSMQVDIGGEDASIMVASDIPVIPERAMYRNNRREGHDSIGTTVTDTDYYLAEGATGYDVGYMTYVLVQNPQATPTDVTITYQTGTGQVAGPAFQMPANSRKTVRVNDQLQANTDVSTHVHGSQAIIAERAMYWDNGTGEACHDSIGMSAPAEVFYLPDGQTSDGRETWTLVQNPGSAQVTVKVSYLPAGGGTPVSFSDTIPADSRRSYSMVDAHIDGRAAVMVESTAGGPVLVERAMYWNSRGAGTDTIGGYSD